MSTRYADVVVAMPGAARLAAAGGVPTVPAGPALGPRLGPASGRQAPAAAAPAAPVKRGRGRPRKNPAK